MRVLHIKSLFTLVILVTSSPVSAQELLKTVTTWEGGEIVYPGGQAQISSVKMRFEPDVDVPFHCHPVPTLGYILEGTLKVETKDGKTTLLQQGDSAVEVMRTVHKGVPVDGPVELVVFYAGSTALPNTVFPDADPDNLYCNE